jgi:glutathione S-transferase
MLTLYTFTSAYGVPDLSPFVTKVATWLRITGIAHETAPGDPRRAPKGKLPYIDHDGIVLSDSTFILEYLSRVFEIDLDAGMNAREQSLAHTMQCMLEEHLYFTTLYLRWKDARGWAVMEPEVSAMAGRMGVPGPLRGAVAAMVRRGPLRALKAQGMGRHTVDEVETLACRDLEALVTLLGDGPYFFGDRPRTFDAIAWAFVQGIRRVPIDNRPRALVLDSPALNAWADRIEAAYWPEFVPGAPG